MVTTVRKICPIIWKRTEVREVRKDSLLWLPEIICVVPKIKLLVSPGRETKNT